MKTFVRIFVDLHRGTPGTVRVLLAVLPYRLTGDGAHRGGSGQGHGRNDHWDDCHRRPLCGVRRPLGHRSAEKAGAVNKVW